MTVRVQPDVAQLDNQVWLSLRELQNRFDEHAREIRIQGATPQRVLKPASWTYGYPELRMALAAGDSPVVRLEGRRRGGTAPVVLIPNTTLNNTGSGYALLSVVGTTLIADDYLSFEVHWQGQNEAISLFLNEVRRT